MSESRVEEMLKQRVKEHLQTPLDKAEAIALHHARVAEISISLHKLVEHRRSIQSSRGTPAMKETDSAIQSMVRQIEDSARETLGIELLPS